ncbi:MAG TPA: T9SS type A sorting domain-containing protein [Bacteroidia bacterium]|nr:T9SS type A sorting domain-containing protein [Bacteroidia bacterium]
MKKVYNLVAVCGLSLLTIGAGAQVTSKVTKKSPTQMSKTVPTARHFNHKPTGAGTNVYAFLDYPYSDSLIANQYTLGYSGSPSLGQPGYIQDFNTRYNLGDTGATATNNTLIHSASVVFDTILDAISGNGYSYYNSTNPKFDNGVTVDSLFIPIGQQNVSGMNDTLVVQINGVTAGAPNATVLWSQTIIQDTGLSGKGKNWLYGYELQLNPNLAVNGPFAVTIQYFSGVNHRDSCGFLYGFPTSTCSGNSAFPDTTKIGGKIGGVYKLNAGLDSIKGKVSITANTFLTGWQYISSAKPATTSPILTMPSKETYAYPTNTYLGGDDYFGQQCTSGSNTIVSSNGYQDMAIFALVYANIDGVNNVNNSGLSVGQNYPNPYNKTTNISYSLTKSSDVVFTVSDITGRTLVNNTYSNSTPGQHVISLNATDFTPGVYFYTFNVNGSVVTKKMVISE